MNPSVRRPPRSGSLRRGTALAPRVFVGAAAPHGARIARPAASAFTALAHVAQWPTRARRIACVLAAIWVLNAFDLCFTVTASDCRHFDELNPIARGLIGEPLLLTVYKLLLLVPCTLIFAALRQRRIAELAAWLGLSVYTLVTLRWLAYYGHISMTLHDPAVPIETARLVSALP